MKKIVIFGGTSAIAEHCARLWVATPCHLLLVGRNREKLEIVAQDLRIRSPGSVVETEVKPLLNSDDVKSLVDEVWQRMGAIDIALVAQGSLPDQAHCQQALSAAYEALNVNGIIPAQLCEALAGKMAELNAGTIAVIGSVAGDRGRKSNYIYGAAKAMIDTYLQGMQHRFASSNICISIIKPGPTDTPMTAHLRGGAVKLAKVDQVAQDIVNGINNHKRIIYSPGKWQLIMLIVRLLPFFIFKKLDI